MAQARRKRKKGKTKISGDGAGKEIESCWLGAAAGASSGGDGKKLKLTTGSKDYDGNLGLPEKVAQRKYETTGQFFRRLDRLVAKAKVEASLESRFDVNLSRKEEDKFKKARRRSSKLLDSDKIMLESSRKYRDKRRKRYGR